MKLFARLFLPVLVLTLLSTLLIPAYAAEDKEPYTEVETSHNGAHFTYELFLTDKSGLSVTNPRTMAAGDQLFVELRLTREDYNGQNYDSYGIEFRLLTRGLSYNYDGRTLRSDTDVREKVYSDGDSVGFAWYDLMQTGESINNPVLAASWSYTVEDPSAVNITVPVALIYITEDQQGHVAVGPATLFLNPNGGKITGEDVSGTYTSGDVVVLPGAELGEAVFAGWSDGAYIYPAGSEYTVSGVVTLTAVWENLERNRHLLLDLKGGELVGEDITGYYADGEIVVLPEATREGYDFVGWNDGVSTYDANAEYIVYNTVTISALWEEASGEPTPPPVVEPTEPDRGGPWGAIVGGALGLIVLFLLFLLWKRRLVKYSLVNGNISLNYKNGKTPAEVEVILYDGAKEYHLNKSGTVEVKCRLKFIRNVTNVIAADIEPGIYKGKLLIHTGGNTEVRVCRIKALDRELDE